MSVAFGLGVLKNGLENCEKARGGMVVEILKANFREKIHRESRLNRILKRGIEKIVKKAYKRLHENHVCYKMIGRSLVDFVRIIRRIKKKLLLDSFRNFEKKNWSLEKDQNLL